MGTQLTNGQEDGVNRQQMTVPYLLGELSAAEETLFEGRLFHGNPASQELEELMDALTSLAESIARHMPAPRKALKDRVMQAALASQRPEPKQYITREETAEWIERPEAPGIKLQILFKDPITNMYNVKVRLAPGAEYPAHRHVGMEHCFVVSGDVTIDKASLTAGDYVVTEDGAEHHRTYSVGGCELLLTTLLEDEVLQ